MQLCNVVTFLIILLSHETYKFKNTPVLEVNIVTETEALNSSFRKIILGTIDCIQNICYSFVWNRRILKA